MSAEIKITSLVGYKAGEPLIQLEWGNEQGQLTSTEARTHAMRILEAADAAESDLFLFTFATEQIGTTVEGAAKLIREFREFREKRNQPR